MEEFCGAKFWNTTLIWHTTDPYLSRCFEETALIWVPTGFLILFALLDVNFARISKRSPLPWNWFITVKCILHVALAAVSVAQLILIHTNTSDSDKIYDADVAAPSIRTAGYVVILILTVVEKKRGIRSSGVQFFYWFLSLVCEGVLFRTAVRKYDGGTDTRDEIVYLMRFIIFPLVTIEFLLNCWADGSFSSKDDTKIFGNPCPEKNSSYFSKLLFLWYDGMAWKGYKKPLDYSDLWDLNELDSAKSQVPEYLKYWEAAKDKAAKASIKSGKTVQASVLSALFRTYGSTFVLGGVFKLAQDLLVFVSPEILKLLIAHISNPAEESWKGFLYASVLFISSVLQTLVGVQYSKRMYIIGMRIRTSLSCAVYKKALVVSNEAKKESTVGEIVNLMSVDTQRFMDLTPMVHMLWSSPVQIAIALYFLYNALGPAIFAGLAIMILLIPINGMIAARVRNLQMKQMVLKDHRVKLMSELLSGMKVLKLYAWEPSFQDQINTIREQELKLLKSAAYLNASTIFTFTCAPFLVSLATFATYVLSDDKNVLNAEKAFVALTLFNIIRMPLTMFPMVIALMVQATVSVNRLNKYMNSEEIDLKAVTHDANSETPLEIKNGTFSWTDESITLQDINFSVKKGSLVAVVGTVGSGKSSLLNSLLGDLKKHNGTINTDGTIAYVAQGAWIQNASLRDNILFGDRFSDSKYDRVIESCALKTDLEILSAGDKTEIGEKGINLSGGQKQRVSLARAAYKESDIYLFDDPLSAVDSHVGKHIFENLIGPSGILRKKTRVLVTHGISYLPQVDNIIVMKDGKITEVGTYKELLIKKGEFADFLIQHLGSDNSEEIDHSIIKDLEEVVGAELRRSSSFDASRLLQRLASKESIKLKPSKKEAKEPEPVDNKEKLIEAEKTETGNVKASIYVDYAKKAGFWMTFNAFGFMIVFQGFASASNIWLSDWSDQATIDEKETNGTVSATTSKYLGGYGGLGFAQAVTIMISTIALALGTLNSAAALHSDMLKRIMKAPMSYFDTTPLGRLVNRFAKDVDTADNMIPQNIRAWMNMFFGVLSTMVVISYSTPVFLAFIAPVGVFYYFLQRFYVATSRQLKRLESVSRSPIYSHFGETISGATTIRAFALQDDFVLESEKKVDYNQRAYYPFIASNLWITVRLETIGSFIILFAAIFAVLSRESISPGIVGLSISYSLQVTMILNFLVRMTTDLETNIVAVERMKELTEISQEAEWEIEETKPAKEWPVSGEVKFEGYETRYREGLDLVIRGITCIIKPGEKVGIVGRTGAGKSSLTLALFRLVEPAAGKIYIDGTDIETLGLHHLRAKITIIPQDPVLFSGTLRVNLDPFNLHSDDQVWSCLELAHLKTFVKGLPQGLLYEVAEEGQNFSVGQRQLVCLARALLRKTKILVLDEATAAVDLETDDLIQKTIRSEFEHSTVITIAHRLNTIMDSNRVIVLDKGEIKEYDTPSELLKNTSTIFYGMAKDAGIV